MFRKNHCCEFVVGEHSFVCVTCGGEPGEEVIQNE
jgi:hypothetical protein